MYRLLRSNSKLVGAILFSLFCRFEVCMYSICRVVIPSSFIALTFRAFILSTPKCQVSNFKENKKNEKKYSESRLRHYHHMSG